MRKIDRIVLHATATKPDHDVTVEDVRKWHTLGNGWSDCGYHVIITLSGDIQYGRPMHRQGAGVRGHNKDTIHVAYVGGLTADSKPADTMNALQVRAFYAYVTGFVTVVNRVHVIGHNDLNEAKACPCFDVYLKFAELVDWARAPHASAPPLPPDMRPPVVKYCRKCQRRMMAKSASE